MAETPAARDAHGLERPVRVTIHSGRDKDRVSRTLLLGKVDAAKKGVYAMRAGEPSVLLVPDDVYNQVPKNVGVLRNKTLVEIDRDKVARLEIQSPNGTVTVARENGQWKIVAPQVLAADQGVGGCRLWEGEAGGQCEHDRGPGRPNDHGTLTD